MQNQALTTACRSCGGTDLKMVLSLGEQPLANALVAPDRLDQPDARYPLEVALCTACSLAQLTVSVPPEEMFGDYAYFSSFSPTVVSNAADIVSRVVTERTFDSANLAMEIASNDGYLLKHYMKAGVPVLGIDPAKNVAAEAEANGVRTLCAFFGLEVAKGIRAGGEAAGVIHANNVMAHVPDPNDVLAGIAEVLADDGVAIIETPYIRELVERLEFDTIYHEHMFYYSLKSFSTLAERNGLTIVDVERIPIHGGTLRLFAMKTGAKKPSAAVERLAAEEAALGMDKLDYYHGFADRVEGVCVTLRALLAELRAAGRRVAGYGAAAKATVLLNALGVGSETIEFVSDLSPHKQGLYIPGARVPIVPAEALCERMPDDVVIFAWNFAGEIAGQQSDYRERGGRFIVPIPEPTFL